MIVALTGIVLMAFVIGHLLGNLQIFLGPRWVNDYAQHLRDLGPLLWLVRITLLVAVLFHIYFTISLALENRRARPQRYQTRDYIKASYASRHMLPLFRSEKMGHQNPVSRRRCSTFRWKAWHQKTD